MWQQQSGRDGGTNGSAVVRSRCKHRFDTVNDTASISLVINVIGSGQRRKEGIRTNLYRLQAVLPSIFTRGEPRPSTLFALFINYIRTRMIHACIFLVSSTIPRTFHKTSIYPAERENDWFYSRLVDWMMTGAIYVTGTGSHYEFIHWINWFV